MVDGLHHFHKRKRMQQGAHPDRLKDFIDRIIYVVGIAGPIMTIPQLWKIWVEKNAAGVSVLSWAGYLIAAVFWLIYGIVHKEKPIIVTYVLWILLEAMIVLGTVIYG